MQKQHVKLRYNFTILRSESCFCVFEDVELLYKLVDSTRQVLLRSLEHNPVNTAESSQVPVDDSVERVILCLEGTH